MLNVTSITPKITSEIQFLTLLIHRSNVLVIKLYDKTEINLSEN